MLRNSCNSLLGAEHQSSDISISEYASSRMCGKTVHIVMREDKDKNCLSKEEMIYDSSNQLVFLRYTNYQNQSVVEFKPTFTNNDIYAIKTERDMNDRILKQGPVNSRFDYHGIVQIFKPHKTRLVKYKNGREMGDMTHPVRSTFIYLATALAALGALSYAMKQCSYQTPSVNCSTQHMRE